MNGLYDEIRIAIHSIWNRRWLALAIAWGIALLGWLAISMIPNSYESKARIYVRTQSFLTDQTGVSTNDQRREVDRLEQTIVSSGNLEKVIKGTDLGLSIKSAKEMAGAVEGLRGKVKIVAEKDNVFEITVSQGNPKLARDIVQKLIDVVQEDALLNGRTENGESMSFLDAELAKRQKELQEAEAKRVAFETEHLGLLPGVGSVSQRLEASRAELAQIDSQLVQASGALAALNGQLAGTPKSLNVPGGAGTAGNAAYGQLSAAQGELAAARARGLTDQHPDIIALKRQISALSGQAKGPSASSGSTSPNPAYTSLQAMQAERQASVSALNARKNAIQADMAKLTSQQIKEPGVAAEMDNINRNYEVLKKQYDELLAQREAVKLRGQVANETNSIRFNILNTPSLASSPSAPNRPLLLTMILLAAIGGGMGAVFALTHLQTSFPTASRLEKASGLPVIGSISQMLTQSQRADRARKMRLFYGGSAALIGVFALLLIVEFVQRGLSA
ncbi:chain-length determining protein [Sphingorhabdus lutea]|uniref:Chain-length determining protein n=1 Tax=Sphingorhabdus lutea TaxID=1913578 RepID=A0A1L3JBE2_9SPHN|nr:XrtA system polysaccharide chain length determinant [Sphingorhabdus lutea]APG62451.1 chain-length determining protein [Sphingorhabdus lutea]